MRSPFFALMVAGVVAAMTNGAYLLVVDPSAHLFRWFLAVGFAGGLVASAMGGFWWGRYERRRR